MTEEEEEDQYFLILKNNDNLPPAYGGPFVFPGSTLLRADCGCECWIAPLALQALGKPENKLLTICTNHFARSEELKQAVREVGFRAIKGQDLELAEVIGKEEAEHIFRMFKMREADL